MRLLAIVLTAVLIVLSVVAIVGGFARLARRLLGMRFGVVRLLAAGLLAFAVVGPIATAVLGTVPTTEGAVTPSRRSGSRPRRRDQHAIPASPY